MTALSTSRMSGINNKLGNLTYNLDPQSTDLLIEDVIEANNGASFNASIYVTEDAHLCNCDPFFIATIPITYTAVVGGYQYEYDTAIGIEDSSVPNWFIKACEALPPLFIPSSYSGSECKVVEFLEQIDDNRIISIVINNTIISS